VYPNDDLRPSVGDKLNKVAHIILSGGVKPKQGTTGFEYEQQLKSSVEQGGAIHLSYDPDSFTWEFRVPHF